MHFGDFPKAIIVWVGSIATAYTLVFLNAVVRDSRGLGASGTKLLLLLVAVAALAYIVRQSKTRWPSVFGSLLVVIAASYVLRGRATDDTTRSDSSVVVHQASLGAEYRSPADHAHSSEAAAR